MLKNYLFTAIRNLWREKGYAFIKILGLSMSLMSCIFITLYIQHEKGFDQTNRNKKRVFRIVEKQNQAGTWYDVAKTPPPLANKIKLDFTGVDKTANLIPNYDLFLSYEGFSSDKIKGVYTQSSLLDMLDLSFIQGGKEEAFAHPNSIVLTEGLAERIFGKEDPMGKWIEFQSDTILQVRGIIRNLPKQSHMPLDCIIPLDYLTSRFGMDITNWNQNFFYTYVMLAEGVSPDHLARQINQFVTKDLEWDWVTFSLQPLTDIYLHSFFAFNTDFGPRGDYRYVRYSFLIGLIILLIASINIINMSIASASKRMKEIGMRKISGASRKQIGFQFMGEAFLSTLISFLLGITGVQLTLPLFNSWTQLHLTWANSPYAWLVLGALFLLTVLMTGLYPSWILGAKSPKESFSKKAQIQNSRGISLRNSLIVLQFSAAIILIGATLGISLQLNFVQNKKLGLNTENLVYVELTESLFESYSEIKTALQSFPEVQSVSGTNFYSMPFSWVGSGNMYQWPGKQEGDNFYMSNFRVDYGFENTLKLKLSQGRFFDPQIGSDTAAILINQTAAKKMGLENPLGQQLNPFNRGSGTIIGVIEDFHFSSLHKSIEPAMIQVQPDAVDYLLVNISPAQTRRGIARLRTILNRFSTGRPYQIEFLDQTYKEAYRAELLSMRMLRAFSFLAIFLSCLGLLGMALITTHQKTKEIGIRKVLGASVSHILLFLTQKFLLLIGIAMLIGIPLSWLGIHSWLENFSYVRSLPWWMWLAPSLGTVIIALATIGIHTWKTATRNPLLALRYE